MTTATKMTEQLPQPPAELRAVRRQLAELRGEQSAITEECRELAQSAMHMQPNDQDALNGEFRRLRDADEKIQQQMSPLKIEHERLHKRFVKDNRHAFDQELLPLLQRFDKSLAQAEKAQADIQAFAVEANAALGIQIVDGWLSGSTVTQLRRRLADAILKYEV